MRSAMFAYEPYIRLGAFGGVFAVMALWELIGPRRIQLIGSGVRWPNNLGVVVANTLVVRLVFPTTAVGLALLAETRGWGLFNLMAFPAWVGIVSSVVVLDLAIYLQHVLSMPCRRCGDCTACTTPISNSMNHRAASIRSILFMIIKLTVVAALGPLAVLIRGAAERRPCSSWQRRIPTGLDRVLRWIVVTPDMHRVHHSILSRETNSNFGFNLPWWDRLFGTYRAQPAAGHDGMTIGIEQFREPRELGLDRMLLQPFRGDAGRYPLGRREGEQ